jgi:anti-sigma regulatory factor (Ser/Thr protein kinase)
MAERKILLDSTLDSVEVAETAVLGAAREIGFHEDDLHQLGMAVRESMVNAVVHGNRYNSRKKVHLSVTKAPDRPTKVMASIRMPCRILWPRGTCSANRDAGCC